jgi:hypothetical protein
MLVIQGLTGLRQEDAAIKASLGYIVGPCLSSKKENIVLLIELSILIFYQRNYFNSSNRHAESLFLNAALGQAWWYTPVNEG